MLTVILTYWRILSIVLIFALFAVFFFAPNWASVMAVTAFFLSLTVAIFSVVDKQMEHYQDGPTDRIMLMRKIFFEIMGVMLAIILAGLCGPYIAKITTGQINNDLTRLFAAILISLLAGMGIGVLVKWVWARFV